MTRQAVFPPDRQHIYERNGYSAAILSGDHLFVSGQVGSRDDGTPEPGFEAQVRRTFDNLRNVLAAAGCSFDDVVEVTSFHTDPEAQMPTVMKEKARAFPKAPYPAWTAVGVTWLAGYSLEIKVVARAPAPAKQFTE